jgi:hypothetical protein
LTILTWSSQYFLHFVLDNVVVVDVRQARFWINVVANVPDSHANGSCKLMAENQRFTQQVLRETPKLTLNPVGSPQSQLRESNLASH